MTELQITWFALWALLWAVYFMLDGFDFGLGLLMPFFARHEAERRVLYAVSGPFWDGNEVWLITAGGVTFAAFPKAYATLFSALYAPLLILLFALIFRAAAFEFRNKIDWKLWRRFWDLCKFGGSALPALLLGVAFANLFQGIPIDREGVFQGNIQDLHSPYALLGGALFMAMFAHHGLLWLAFRSEGALRRRALDWSRPLWLATLGLTLLFFAASALFTSLYANSLERPLLFALPLAALLFLCGAFFSRPGALLPWLCSGLFIVCLTFFGFAGMFPALVPSSLNPDFSVTLLNGSSNALSLKIMLGVALAFMPLVIAYQFFAYKIFSHKINVKDLESGAAY